MINIFSINRRMNSNRNGIYQKMKNMANRVVSSNSSSNTSTVTNSSSKMDYKKILSLGAMILLVVIVIYLLISIYYYNREECEGGATKRTFGEYLLDISERKICNEPIKQEPIAKDFKLSDIQLPTEKEEVFHISNQDYTYDQAKCKCASYGGKLATKEQVIDAYNKGATWCSYGWTNGQNAFYPVQQCDYDKMVEENRTKPRHLRQRCGKPGVNGGYFANPYIKFGVNCYGVKPKGESVIPKKPYCPPMNFCKLERNFQASHKLDTDEIAPFAPGKWNNN